jgi:hypothetical protein
VKYSSETWSDRENREYRGHEENYETISWRETVEERSEERERVKIKRIREKLNVDNMVEELIARREKMDTACR